MRDAVTLHMSADPNRIWELVSDVTRVGEFSPETFGAEWIGTSTGPELGAKFRGHVDRNGWGLKYSTVCKVIACEPGREFAFTVLGPGGLQINTWRYRLEPDDSGTAVTESFELHDFPPLRLYWLLAGRLRGKTNRDNMTETLGRIKTAVEG